MLISLYSGMASWVAVPGRVTLTGAAGLPGPLIFEGTINSQLLSAEVLSRIGSEWKRRSFARVSEDLGLVLLEACLKRDDRDDAVTPTLADVAWATQDSHRLIDSGQSARRSFPMGQRTPIVPEEEKRSW